MPAPVVVEFLVKSMPSVINAFRTVEQAAVASERAQTTARARGAQQRSTTADREARDKIRVMLKTDAEVKRIYDREVRAAATAAKQKVTAEARAEREMLRSADRAANERLRIARHVDREYAAMQKRRSAEDARIIREDDRRQEQAAKNRMRIRERSASMAGRYAAQESARETRDRSQFARGAYGHISSGVAAGANHVRRGVSAAAGMLGQLGGGFAIADAIKEQAELEKSAVMFSNAAHLGKGERIDPKQLQGEAKAAAVLTGQDSNELMKGAHAFLAKTGNAAESRASMKLFGDIATGTGANIEDVAKAAGTLRVQNSDLDPKAMKSILLQTVRQGQKGSIEFSDLASSIGKVTRTSSGYVGNQAKTQAELLGIAQLGMATMSDPRDVATSLAGVESDTKKHWKQMQATMGPDTFDKMGRITNGPSEFIANVMEKSGGDTRKLQEMGFGKQAMKYFQALAPEFQKAGGGAEGKKALLTKMRDAVAEPMGEAELQTNVKNVLNTSAKQFEIATAQLKMAVGEQLMPEFVKLAKVLIEHMPQIRRFLAGLGEIANWAASHPFAAIGAIMAAEVTKSIAMAGIGELIKRLIAGAMPGGGGASGALGGVGGAAAGGVAAGVAAGAVIYNAGSKYADGTFKADDLAAKVRAYGQGNRASGIAPEAAMEEVQRAQGRLDKNGGTFNQVGNIISSPFSDQASKDYGQYKNDQALVDNKALIAAIKEVTIAVKQQGGSPGGGPDGKPPAASTGIVQRAK